MPASSKFEIPDLSTWNYYEYGLYYTYMFASKRPRSFVGCLALTAVGLGTGAWFAGHVAVVTTMVACPSLLWTALLVGRFPVPRGPYGVGCVDVEWRAPCADGDSPFRACIFYPSSRGRSLARSERQPWLPSPADEYLEAYGGLYGLSRRVSRLLLLSMRMARMQCSPGAPCADGKWPVVFFSHGLCGCRTTYSTICTELASQGHIVVALEHADGSAALAITSEKSIAYVSYGEASGSLRERQLKQRVREFQAAKRSIADLQESMLLAPDSGDHCRLVDVGLTSANIDLDNCVLLGHSFGGATVMLAAQTPAFRGRPVAIMDPWLGPSMSTFSRGTIASPILAIMTCSMTWPQNAEDLVSVLSAADAEKQLAFFTELEGARHMDQSDVPFVAGWPMKLITSSSQTRRAHTLWESNAELVLRFMRWSSEPGSANAGGATPDLSSVPGAKVHDWKSWKSDSHMGG